MHPAFFMNNCDEGHPEEPAYRCCLPALAGFGKYLPPLSREVYPI